MDQDEPEEVRGMNLKIWKWQMHVYLIVKGHIDPIKKGNMPTKY
mgnify:CR=1 FL=1